MDLREAFGNAAATTEGDAAAATTLVMWCLMKKVERRKWKTRGQREEGKGRFVEDTVERGGGSFHTDATRCGCWLTYEKKREDICVNLCERPGILDQQGVS